MSQEKVGLGIGTWHESQKQGKYKKINAERASRKREDNVQSWGGGGEEETEVEIVSGKFWEM